jgi:DNA segregation ATPase FtsK/SpoIIIE-like protein
MSEIDKYEAQIKKLDGLCEEHDLSYRFNHNQYPITLTIRPLTGMDEQLSMMEQAESRDYISADASMVIYRKDGDLATKINGTFTISEALRSKFKNIYLKLADFWLQYYQRDTLERNVVNGANMPVIDEDEAEDSDEPPEDLDDPDEVIEDPDEDEITAATLLVRQENKASISLLQRRLKLGYSRAARLMDALEAAGVVGPLVDNMREVLPVDVPEETYG